MRQLATASCELGDSSAWTDETELECLRILGRATALASRAATHVWIGCVAGESAVVIANDPSVARAASAHALQRISDDSLRAVEPPPAISERTVLCADLFTEPFTFTRAVRYADAEP